MKNNYQDDLRLLKKAKHRVNAMLIVSYVFLCVWPGAVYFLLGQPLFSRPDNFHVLYLVSMLVEMVLWMLIFFAISGGQPKSRILLPVGIAAEFAFCAWLIYQAFLQLQFLFVYIVWIILELVKNFYLLWLNGWLKSSWWARIFFDKVIAIPESEREYDQQRQQAIRQSQQAAKQARIQAANRVQTQRSQASPSYTPQQPAQRQVRPNPAANNSQNYPGQNPACRQANPAQSVRQPQAGYSGSYGQNQPPMGNANAGNYSSAPYPNQVPNTANRGGYNPNALYGQGPDFANTSPALANTSNGQPAPFAYAPDIQSQQDQSANANPVRIPVKAPVDIAGNPHEEALRRREQEKENRRKLSSRYPRMAIRIAAVVYGELILFPTIVHIFQDNFVSMDGKSVFALNLMFTLCILTAVLWTLPVFFLYLKQPGCKKIVWGAGVGQILIAAFGSWMLSRYGSNEDILYPAKVFTLFLILEVMRYGLLIVGVAPAFKLPEIHDSHSGKDIDEDEDDEMAGYEFELIDEEDPACFDDVDDGNQDIGEFDQPEDAQDNPLDAIKDKISGWLHH